MSDLTEKNLDYLEEFWSDISRVENADPEHLQNDILAYVKQMRYYRKQSEKRGKALEWYANENNYCVSDRHQLAPVEQDFGYLASKALGKEQTT